MPRIVTVKIGGESHSIDLDDVLRIHNADEQRHNVAADMAWWGTIAAAAEAQVARLTAAAASWHADALVKCLQVDDKMSEWKAKANATSHTEYARMQLDIANAGEMAGRASTVHWALVRLMDMLKAMINGETNDKRGSTEIGHSAPAPASGLPDPRLKGYKKPEQRRTTTASKEE